MVDDTEMKSPPPKLDLKLDPKTKKFGSDTPEVQVNQCSSKDTLLGSDLIDNKYKKTAKDSKSEKASAEHIKKIQDEAKSEIKLEKSIKSGMEWDMFADQDFGSVDVSNTTRIYVRIILL